MALFRNPIEYAACPKCSDENLAVNERCQNCGIFLQNKRNVRVGSLIFIYLGGIPMTIAIVLGIWFNQEISEPKNFEMQPGWRELSQENLIAFGIILLLLVYGAALFAVGVLQLWKGEFYPRLSKVVINLVWVFLIMGIILSAIGD